jgi:hypothetical protein
MASTRSKEQRGQSDGNGATQAKTIDPAGDAVMFAAKPAPAAGAAPSAPPTVHYASIYPGPHRPAPPPPPEFVALIKRLEAAIGMPVWLLVQSGNSDWDILDNDVPEGFMAQLDDLPEQGGIALLIDSPGGLATASYKLARILQRRCGGFVALVPRYAKSAATLLCLGAQTIVMDEHAELGPLDAQIFDLEREQPISALDEVQALEQLTVGSLESLDQLMILLLGRTGKRVDTLLPHVIKFVTETTRPLYEKIDTVHYTQTARLLRVAEQYAIRLLAPYHPHHRAREIAAQLIERYPAHEFVIDRDEAAAQGIQVAEPPPEVVMIYAELNKLIRRGLTLIGRLEEVTA